MMLICLLQPQFDTYNTVPQCAIVVKTRKVQPDTAQGVTQITRKHLVGQICINVQLKLETVHKVKCKVLNI